MQRLGRLFMIVSIILGYNIMTMKADVAEAEESKTISKKMIEDSCNREVKRATDIAFKDLKRQAERRRAYCFSQAKILNYTGSEARYYDFADCLFR